MSQQGGVYHEQGTGNLIVPDGKKIVVETGGAIEAEGDVYVAATFDADYFEVNDGEVTLKADVAALLEIIAGIPTSDPENEGEVWLDGTTLKVSEGGGG